MGRHRRLLPENEDGVLVEVSCRTIGRPVTGVEAILAQDPFQRPTVKRPKRSPRPQFHVASSEALCELRAEYAELNLMYELASQALRSGDLEAAHRFPPPATAPRSSII